MAGWKNISILNPITGDIDLASFEVELNRRLKFVFGNIDISQILFNLNDISGTLNLSKGGTGSSLSAPAADRLLFYDKSANKTDWLIPGAGLTISGTTLSAVLNAILLGTNNQITVTDNGDGTYTLSTPQDLHTGANPTFNNITGAGLVKGATGHFGGATHYSQFESDGTLKFNGDATVWKDIDFPIIIRTTGAGIPSLATIQGNISAPQWQVDDFNVCEGQEFVHEWKEGSEVRWHVHMLTNGLDATDRYVKWEVEWFWVNPDGQISASDTQSYEFTIPANTPDKTMFVVQIYQWTPINGEIAGHCYARLKRIASAGTAPTNNPWCTMLQLHIECDTAGSRQYMTK